ncbi:MAG: hypothetical protein WA857_09305 [Candidatus Acidiferrum sp.]
MKNVTPALLLSVPCPICEVAAGNPCMFHSGVLRSEPHLDRKILAADVLETKRTQRTTPEANSLSSRVMKLFGTMGEDRLSLRVLFEVAGSSVKERLRVIEAIDELVLTGMLEACGDEFYLLTEKAKVTIP